MKITIIYDDKTLDGRLVTDFGFSAYIEGLSQNILFDTGTEGGILLYNMETLGIDPKSVGVLFLSHHHSDHTGGAEALLEQNPDIPVYLLSSFSDKFTKYKEVISDEPVEVVTGARSTGKMGTTIEEQSLILSTNRGYVVVTGCSHPSVADIVERARQIAEGNIYLVIGGFHLGSLSKSAIRGIIKRLRGAGVKKVAPAHCTGEIALQLFREEYKEDYIDTGVGSIIAIE